MDALQILSIVGQAGAALTSVIGAAAVICALTPTKRDDEVVSKVSRVWNQVRPVLDILGANVRNAKNAGVITGAADLLKRAR